MPILDTTTWAMACLAALGDSPNLFPFSSVTGIPYFNSLGEDEWQNTEWLQLLEGQAHRGSGASPLSHEGYVDTVSSSNGGEGDKAADDRREMLQRTGADETRQPTQDVCGDTLSFWEFTWAGGNTLARDFSPSAVTTAPVVALT